ncbi:MAG: ATP-dependent RecD-like DNA helicase [bacterium]|nr:ATP-dependent RecD-like DNA helicase [bacterium]
MDVWIKGYFKKYIYKTENGYVVGLFKVLETNSEALEYYQHHSIPFTGYFHELNEEDTYIFHGKLVEHDKYGEQFQVESYERVLPEEKDAIVDFLSSGLFKGIGEKTARRIVEYLGRDTLTIILEQSNNLLLIPGLTKKQIAILHDTLVDYEASYQTVIALSEMGFSTKESLIIYHKYKQKALDVIDQNIYLLMEDILDMTFKKVDSLALKSGVLKDDTRRVMASILYVFLEVQNLYGHSYLEKEEIFSYTIRALGNSITKEVFDISLQNLIDDMKVICDQDRYYLKEMYEAEENIAKRIGYLTRKEDCVFKKLDAYFRKVENFTLCQYNLDQEQAIKQAILKHFLIITGGPGTGKTTIMKAICLLYQEVYHLRHDELAKEMVLLAPTGRASKRISEFTNIPALTIHRFLKWNKENNHFAVNEYHKSDVKIVIIDEFSMVDTILFHHLLNGLRYDTKIILVGDYHQLPSVGPGQLLKDMIESGSLPMIELRELYRQATNSNIISLAYQIKENCLNYSIFHQKEDLEFVPVSSNLVKDKVLEISSLYIKDLEAFQVLAPMYKTINGIDLLNVSLQDIFNPVDKKKKELLIHGVLFREGDKVIQLTNMPDDNVFNGDIGYITSIIVNGNKKEILICFDGNEVRYTASNFHKFKHAYAISIHKSQGSEFDYVVIPIVKGYGKMLYRKLIYTGVTRVKKKLYLVGEIEALDYSILHDISDVRKTTLKEKIVHNFQV